MSSARSGSNRSLRCLAVVLFGLAILAGAKAQAAAPGEGPALERPIDFDIPSQNLADALDRFSRTSNLQVLYDSRLAVGQHSTALNGVLPISTALKTLLQGTGLLIHYTSHHDIVLTSVTDDAGMASTSSPDAGAALSLRTLYVYPPTAEPSPPTNTMPYRLYGDLVRSRILAALERNEATNQGNYTIKLSIWVSPSGTLLRHTLLESSGDSARDRRIAAVLRNLDFNQPPPADLPQPIDFGIAVAAP
jgi:TonB family protein